MVGVRRADDGPPLAWKKHTDVSVFRLKEIDSNNNSIV